MPTVKLLVSRTGSRDRAQLALLALRADITGLEEILWGISHETRDRNVVRAVAPPERQKPWPNLRLTKAIVLVAPTGFEPALPP